jgi:hypothetical protein
VKERWWIQVFFRGKEYPNEVYTLEEAKRQTVQTLSDLGLQVESLKWVDRPRGYRADLGSDGEVLLTRIDEETEDDGAASQHT